MTKILRADFRRALTLHQSGRLPAAEKLYRKVLQGNPDHADALHLLGIIASESGHHAAAEALISRAISLRGPLSLFCANLGLALSRQGKYAQAAVCYRQALLRDPANPSLLVCLGQAQNASGYLEAAEQSFRAATACQPDLTEAHFELGNVLCAKHEFSRAGEAYEMTLRCQPGHARALYNLGVIRTIQTRIPEAESCYRAALRLLPQYAEAHNNLGILLQCAGNAPEALWHYRAALASKPSFTSARYNLASLLQKTGKLDEACLLYREILRSEPNHADAHNNLGNSLLALGKPREALMEFERSSGICPENPEARFNLGIANLTLGNYREGWAGYEWRDRVPPGSNRMFSSPRWDGSPLAGKRLLLWGEQGLGDTIQFVRFIKLLKERDASIILECRPALAKLLARMPGVDRVIPSGSPTPEHDFHLPLMSLPHVLGSGENVLSGSVPYLSPEPEKRERWRQHLQAHSAAPRLRVGLCWAGNPLHRNDANRSLPPAEFDRLSRFASGIAFVDLQVQPRGAPQIAFLPGLETLDDFDVTAALAANLDLVISADTAVAHLAGALGRTVWLLLPYAADWRWLTGRNGSPWYPGMRLFRQPAPGDWASAMKEAMAALDNAVLESRRAPESSPARNVHDNADEKQN